MVVRWILWQMPRSPLQRPRPPMVSERSSLAEGVKVKAERNALLDFARVVKAREQVAAGTLHHLTVEAIEGGEKKLYEAKVWVYANCIIRFLDEPSDSVSLIPKDAEKSPVVIFAHQRLEEPFWARTESGIFRLVLRVDPNFDDAPWSGVSAEAKDFVKRLLNKDYRKRMTAVQALSKHAE
ncbi:hypothetical protein ZIOFF_070088 [Zingiber officinale]|uniref:Cysteine proteinase inhibitor n=1 Tax=Zingiber officinale TaxID=94328 RepID=A0A8J5CEJ6_ZINOF|nr:hypothetical protein ZIOFF_070088 [Zingiber officinale]